MTHCRNCGAYSAGNAVTDGIAGMIREALEAERERVAQALYALRARVGSLPDVSSHALCGMMTDVLADPYQEIDVVVQRAIRIDAFRRDVLDAGLPWSEPESTSESGEPVLRWHRFGDGGYAQTLSLKLRKNGASYEKEWGAYRAKEREVGEVQSFAGLFEWLTADAVV